MLLERLKAVETVEQHAARRSNDARAVREQGVTSVKRRREGWQGHGVGRICGQIRLERCVATDTNECAVSVLDDSA